MLEIANDQKAESPQMVSFCKISSFQIKPSVRCVFETRCPGVMQERSAPREKELFQIHAYVHAFIQHTFIKACFKSGPRLGKIKMGRTGPALKEIGGERRRKTVNRSMWCSGAGCSGSLGRARDIQGKSL